MDPPERVHGNRMFFNNDACSLDDHRFKFVVELMIYALAQRLSIHTTRLRAEWRSRSTLVDPNAFLHVRRCSRLTPVHTICSGEFRVSSRSILVCLECLACMARLAYLARLARLACLA